LYPVELMPILNIHMLPSHGACCPGCGGGLQPVSEKKRTDWWRAFFQPLPRLKRLYRCEDCGTNYELVAVKEKHPLQE
jgi:hypothetical protein